MAEEFRDNNKIAAVTVIPGFSKAGNYSAQTGSFHVLMKLLTPSSIRHVTKIVSIFILFLAINLCIPGFISPLAAHTSRAVHYDIIYFQDKNLDTVLDFEEELEPILGPQVAKSLKIIGTKNGYGVVYERRGSALSASRLVVRHNAALESAGVEASAKAINSSKYLDLYNVSYGLGTNLKSLKQRYGTIYRYLGHDVGKDLLIEKTDFGNYVLIYRRLGDKKSTQHVASRHAKLLKRKGISTSITIEHNSEVVFGESSYLDKDSGRSFPKTLTAVKKSPKPLTTLARVQKISPKNKINKTPVRKTSTSSTSLERKVETYIKRLRRKKKIAGDERTAWLAYDLTTGRNIIDINIDRPLQAASMIKPFVALAFFLKEKEGKLIYGPRSRRKMEAMIQRSNNRATNWLMRHIGGPRTVERTLKKHYNDLFKSIKIVEYIPANGRTYRNKVAPREYGRFLEALWNKKLASGEEIRRLMALPNRDRLYHGTALPRGTLVFDKTGTTAHVCGDMGILAPKGRDGRRYPYILVGVIEKQKRAGNYGRWMTSRSNVIRNVSTLVYSSLKEKYGLL